MRLNGGILTYGCMEDAMNKRYMTNKSPKGRKVIFLNKNGYSFEREQANNLFAEGTELTIKEIYVGNSTSKVEFEEHPNVSFNTVMFADITY